jgi:hypothetical protein
VGRRADSSGVLKTNCGLAILNSALTKVLDIQREPNRLNIRLTI